MDEITPPSRRSIRNIPIPEGRKKISGNKGVSSKVTKSVTKKSSTNTKKITEDLKNDIPSENLDVNKTDNQFVPPTRTSRKKVYGGGKKKIIFSVLGLLLVVLIFFVISLFTGATVKIYPKTAEATVNETVTASDVTSGLENQALDYKIVELSESKSKTIKASGEEEVETKASGFITVYNDYSESSQPLVRRTRFESPEGLIYRIDQSVDIPGKNGDTPGSLRVEVFADGTGEEYNTGPTTFTIPGFEGQPQFDGFYAKSTENIDGGFKGVRKVVSDEDMESAKTELQSDLMASLNSQIDSQTSEDFIVIVNDSLFTFSELKQKETGKSDEVEVELTGTLRAVVISESEFSNFVANEALTTFNQSDTVRINNINDLEIVFEPESVEDGLDSIVLTIKGRADFIWETDEVSLKGELAGNNRKELKNILEDFSSVSRAEAVIRPFWKRSFPEDIEKINIEEVIE